MSNDDLKWIGITHNDLIPNDLKKNHINQIITSLDELENIINKRRNSIINKLPKYPIIGLYNNDNNNTDDYILNKDNQSVSIDSPTNTITNTRSSVDSSEGNIDMIEELEDSGNFFIDDQ